MLTPADPPAFAEGGPPDRAAPAPRRAVYAPPDAHPLVRAADASEPHWLYAGDGYRLSATRFRAPGPPRAHMVVAGAIGVPQAFYRRFAAFVQARGYTAWTVDYRGVGRSAPASLRGFRADLRDWGQRDLAAAVEAAADAARHDGRPLYLVGHSFGGHALGMLPNHDAVRAAYTFGTGAGWHGWMPPRERARVVALWNVVGPVVTRSAGYLPSRRLGLGDDLPLGVYRQWKRWCRGPRFCFDDPADGAELAEAFARVRAPVGAANATDDRWSPPRSRDAIIGHFRRARVDRIDLDPRTTRTGPIGHLGYFRPAAEPLWGAALDWFYERGA